MSGIPGAAVVGDAVIPARYAAIAPGQRFGLISGSDGETLRIWRLDGNAPAPTGSLDGLLSADRIVFSASGNAALLVRHSDLSIQVLIGLPDLPAIHSLRVAPENSSVFAINEAGDVLAGGDAVWLLRENQTAQQLAVAGPVSALAFHGSNALVAAAGQILLVRNVASGSEYRTLAAYTENRTPVAVQFSSDAARAFAAMSDGEILVYSLDAGELARLSCQCRPTGFHQLSGDSLFRLNETGNEPIWLLDTAAQPRLWFVPKPVADIPEGPSQ
jgi:hypothetical protein